MTRVRPTIYKIPLQAGTNAPKQTDAMQRMPQMYLDLLENKRKAKPLIANKPYEPPADIIPGLMPDGTMSKPTTTQASLPHAKERPMSIRMEQLLGTDPGRIQPSVTGTPPSSYPPHSTQEGWQTTSHDIGGARNYNSSLPTGSRPQDSESSDHVSIESYDSSDVDSSSSDTSDGSTTSSTSNYGKLPGAPLAPYKYPSKRPHPIERETNTSMPWKRQALDGRESSHSSSSWSQSSRSSHASDRNDPLHWRSSTLAGHASMEPVRNTSIPSDTYTPYNDRRQEPSRHSYARDDDSDSRDDSYHAPRRSYSRSHDRLESVFGEEAPTTYAATNVAGGSSVPTLPPSLPELNVAPTRVMPRVDYASAIQDSGDEDEKKRLLLAELDLLRNRYASLEIPQLTIFTDYRTVKDTREYYVQRIKTDTRMDQMRMILFALFFGTELLLGYKLGLPMKGYADAQIASMQSYDILLMEIGEDQSLDLLAGTSAMTRLTALFLMNTVAFVGLQYATSRMDKGQSSSISPFLPLVTNFLSAMTGMNAPAGAPRPLGPLDAALRKAGIGQPAATNNPPPHVPNPMPMQGTPAPSVPPMTRPATRKTMLRPNEMNLPDLSQLHTS